MKKTLFGFLALILTIPAQANYLEDNLRKENWGGVEVVWLEDDSYPLYDISVYFQAGSFTDEPSKVGETELAFNLLTTGTNRYKQSEILDSLEFYGASYQANVTHEFSSYNVSGLVKDAVPTLKMVCHMFRNATFPKNELKKSVKRMRTGLRNLSTNHGALANRVFRELSLRGTGYGSPVGGTINSLKKISTEDLKEKITYFNDSVKKRIYIKGPKALASLRSVFVNDCKWGSVSNFVKTPKVSEKKTKAEEKVVYLAPVKQANQAQIRMGSAMSSEEASKNFELRSFAAQYLGGGFTSRLMQKVRVERGLTYSIGAYASEQKNYGRKGINTFTKNETIVETLKAIEEAIKESSTAMPDEQFAMAKRYAKGSYLFGLESTSAFLSNLIYFDHIGREYEEIYKFPKRVEGFKKDQVKAMITDLFGENEIMTLVVGSKSLKGPLEKAGYKVKVIDYKDYL